MTQGNFVNCSGTITCASAYLRQSEPQCIVLVNLLCLSITGSAWADFSDSVRALGTVALAAPRSKAVALQPLDKIEAHRYCSRLLRAGLEGFMENYDPAWPVLRPLPYNGGCLVYSSFHKCVGGVKGWAGGVYGGL